MANSPIDTPISTMPAEFYGGVNPVIKFKQVEKEFLVGGQLTPTAMERALAEKQSAIGGQNSWHPANFLSNPKMMFLIAGIVFVLLIFGGAVYYYFKNRRLSVAIPAPSLPFVQLPQPTESPILAEQISPTTTIENIATSTAEPSLLFDIFVQFPSKTVGISADMDQDGITDQAEDLFGTDLAVPDTDSDGFADGHEINFLYDPNNLVPARLIDAGKFYDFVNPVSGYKVYYPMSWSIGNVDSEYNDVLFSGISGDNIELRSFVMRPGEAFVDWFGRLAADQLYSDLQNFSSYFDAIGFVRNDGLVYYFVDGDKVYVLVYHENDTGGVNFKSIITVMARSFRMTVLSPSDL